MTPPAPSRRGQHRRRRRRRSGRRAIPLSPRTSTTPVGRTGKGKVTVPVGLKGVAGKRSGLSFVRELAILLVLLISEVRFVERLVVGSRRVLIQLLILVLNTSALVASRGPAVPWQARLGGLFRRFRTLIVIVLIPFAVTVPVWFHLRVEVEFPLQFALSSKRTRRPA
jgi:hypothetical protein